MSKKVIYIDSGRDYTFDAREFQYCEETMLLITQFSGQQVYLNPDQILKVEKTPDTTITLITGKKMVVKESCEEIVDKYIDIKRKIYSCPGGMDING